MRPRLGGEVGRQAGVPIALGGGSWQQRGQRGSCLSCLFSLPTEYKVRCSCSKEQLPAGGASTTQRESRRRVPVSPGPSGGSFALCPQCPTFIPLHPSPDSPIQGRWGSDQSSFPSCHGPKHLAKQNCLLGGEQRRVVVLVVPYSRSSLGCSQFHRVSRLFQSHRGDSRWIRITLRASPPLPCPIQALEAAVPPKSC